MFQHELFLRGAISFTNVSDTVVRELRNCVGHLTKSMLECIFFLGSMKTVRYMFFQKFVFNFQDI